MLATTIHKSHTTPHHQDGATNTCKQTRVLSQGPIVCRQPCLFKQKKLLLRTQPPPTTDERLLTAHTPPHAGCLFVVLLRKEVIQPHLPVRLPCYDFVPIADPTFDSSPPYGLGRRLRVLPTFVT